MDNINTLSTQAEILSEAEKIKYAKFWLPLIPCPKCGASHKWSLLNLGFNRSCVSCNSPMNLSEITQEGLKQLEYVHLDVEQTEDQKMIALFRDNVIWMCNYCGKWNANLKKNRRWGAPRWAHANCKGCGSKYIKDDCLLPFLPLQGFWFDDGDDSDDSYELAMLFKTQWLWFQCIRKASQDWMGTEHGKQRQLELLFIWLERVKKRTPKINRRFKDGKVAITYMLNYLWIEKWTPFQHNAINWQREIKQSHEEIFETSEITSLKTLLILSKQKKIWIPATIVTALGISAVIKTEKNIEFEWAYHDVSVLFQEKWTLEKLYHITRHEPYLDSFESVQYRVHSDNTWLAEYQKYYQQAKHYQLENIGIPKLVKNGIISLDTWRDERVNYSYYCPDTDNFSSSWGASSSGNYGSGSFWWGSSESGSSGIWFWSGWSLFLGPEWIEVKDQVIQPDWENRLKTFFASLPDTVITILTMSQPAQAATCQWYRYEDIMINAYRKSLVQNYNVWDWQRGSKVSSGLQEWTDERTTLQELKHLLVQDSFNQKISFPKTSMKIQVGHKNWKTDMVDFDNRKSWNTIHKKTGENCSIGKSFLSSSLLGITQEDIEQQCFKK